MLRKSLKEKNNIKKTFPPSNVLFDWIDNLKEVSDIKMYKRDLYSFVKLARSLFALYEVKWT